MLEDYGYTDTREGKLNRIARYLNDLPNEIADEEDLQHACAASDLDFDTLTQKDIEKIQRKLQQL